MIGKVGKSRIDSLSQRKVPTLKRKVFDRKSDDRKTPC